MNNQFQDSAISSESGQRYIIELRAEDLKVERDWRDVAITFEPGKDDRYSLCIF